MLSTYSCTAQDRDFLSAAYLHSVLCRTPKTPMAVLRAPSMTPKTDLEFRETVVLSLYAFSPWKEVTAMSKLNNVSRQV